MSKSWLVRSALSGAHALVDTTHYLSVLNNKRSIVDVLMIQPPEKVCEGLCSAPLDNNGIFESAFLL
jgi:hypothetical protein